MEEYYSETYSKKMEEEEKIEKEKSKITTKYLDIWKINPSYKDVNRNTSYIKLFSLSFLVIFFAYSTHYLSKNVILSLGVAIITLICFIIAFRDNFYSLQSYVSQKFKPLSKLNLFEDLTFFFVNGVEETIYFSNKKDLVTVAIRIFRVYVMPEKIELTLNQFIKSLNRLLIPYSYQIVQIPITNNTNSLNQKRETYDNFRTAINFSVYFDVKGILNFTKLESLKNKVIDFSDSINSAFSSNFYHFQIELLREKNLINALRNSMLKIDMEDASKLNNDNESLNKFNLLKPLIKLSVCIFILIYTTCLLIGLEMSLTIMAIWLLIESLVIVFVWWRECLFQFTKRNLQDDKRVKIINPLKNIEFYKLKGTPDTIFAHINGKLLIGIKQFNLYYANPRLYSKKYPICTLSKFFRGLIAKRLSFAFTVLLAPVSYHAFYREGFEFLKEGIKDWILNSERGIENEKDGTEWLEIRSGIWKTMMLLSAFSYKSVGLVKTSDVRDIENQLIRKANLLEKTFLMNFSTFKLRPLQNRDLILGVMCECLKNKFFRYDGTHLHYLLFQGKALVQILELVGELKKGVETQIAAEFNTPLQLENHIIIGKTIDTEILQEEVSAGFLLKQAKNLLVVNGMYEDREAITMKIISELIMCTPALHSIIFDFSGDWSKLINLFKNTRYEKDFLHFKLGTTYSINLEKSDVPYDKNNIDYLDYVFETIALAYKRDERTIDTLKNIVLKNPNMGLSTIELDLRNKQEWQKNPSTTSVLALTNELNLQNSTFYHSQENLEGRTTVQDFIDNDKTIIIDLSASNDYKKQVFLSFIIISKLIHQLRDSKQLLNKIIVLPHIDMFFDSRFLDMKINYGKIDKFLNPLKQNGSGFIFMANQAHYLHANVFNYFQNIITFKATDSRDVSVLKNQLGLDQEFGKGYYSNKRKASYQIDYLMSLKPNVVLMKRSNIPQTFPVKLDIKEVQNTKPMDYMQIVEYMKGHGYDLKNIEKELLKQTEKTIFQKDLGTYFRFVDDVIVFLKALSEVHDIFLYKKKIKVELKRCISNTVIKITQDKQEIKRMRDELFDLLLKHGYLIEKHPKTAGGSETMKTSYAVGPKYSIALKDYYEAQADSSTDVSIDVIEKDSKKEYDLGRVFQDESYYTEEETKTINGIEIYAKIVSKYYYDLFRIYNNINKKKFEKALEIEKAFIRRLLSGLYEELHQANYIEESKNIEEFVEYLITNLEFPFTKEEVSEILERCKSLNLEDDDLENKVSDIYEAISDFFNKLQVKASEN